jgi:hypothetical protein
MVNATSTAAAAAQPGQVERSWQGELVQLGAGRSIRRTLHLQASLVVDGLVYDVTTTSTYDEREGRYQARTVTITGRDGAPVDARVMRQVRPHELLRDSLMAYHGGGQVADDETLRELGEQGPTDDTLQAVAAVYRLACLVDDPPVQRVGRAFGVSRATAQVWAARARSAGYLPTKDRRSPAAQPLRAVPATQPA